MYPVDLRSISRSLAGAVSCCVASALAFGCSTTEEQVREQIEVLAANDVGSERWQGAVEALTAIGRPSARQLVALLNPALYRGTDYRDFRGELERTTAGAATVGLEKSGIQAARHADDLRRRKAGLHAVGR